MNIQKIIESLPNRTRAERAEMRAKATLMQTEGTPAQQADAAALLAALDAHDASLALADAEAAVAVNKLPLDQRAKVAFEKDPPSPTERRAIQVLIDHPGSSCAELSAQLGMAPNMWDMEFGALCAKRASFLRDFTGTPAAGKSENLPLLTLPTRGKDGIIRYTMKPEAIATFRQLGFRVKPA